MAQNILNNVRARIRRSLGRFCFHQGAALASAAVITFASCSDWRDGIDPQEKSYVQTPIAFTATVAPSTTATRADGSLINRLETSLFETKSRDYYPFGIKQTEHFSVGLFAAYTKDKTWNEAKVLSSPEKDEYYSANFMFNQKMDIASPDPATGHTRLYYASKDESVIVSQEEQQDSLRYWPNKDASGDYGRLSFWAYYPWNANITAEHGISITSNETAIGNHTYGVTAGGGMGSFLYTMSEDAAEHSDFMMSDLVADCSRLTNPLNGTEPTPVPLRFHHLLAQVRVYAFITGSDKIVYWKNGGETDLTVTAIEGTTVTFSDNSTKEVTSLVVFDAWGAETPLTVGMKVPDDTEWLNNSNPKTIRWKRTVTETQFSGSLYNTGDKVTGLDGHYCAQNTLSLSWNNIHTQCIFTPTATVGGGWNYITTFPYTDIGTLGSATITHYIPNPYWFFFDGNNKRVMLNPTYMYDYFENTPAYLSQLENDVTIGYSKDWSAYNSNFLNYYLSNENLVPDDHRKPTDGTWHYNYAPGNIILAVPQQMSDNDVPNIVITATGKQVRYVWDSSSSKYKDEEVMTNGSSTITARVTVNMLNMGLKWESGFIYCYAFIDDLQPGDDKVRGPESITVVFDPKKQTDQW